MTGMSPSVSGVVETTSQWTAGTCGGDAAEDFAVEVFDDFGAALRPPDFCGGDFLAVVEDERIGEVGVGVGFGFVVVGGVGAVRRAGWLRDGVR